MTINEYFIRHRTDGLRRLADRAQTKLSYLLQLNYTPTKLPSIKMAKRLIDASDGELSFDGLLNPTKTLIRDSKKAA